MSAPVVERFHHEALFYDGIDGFMSATLPFIREGVARREPQLVAVDDEKIGLLRGALGDDAEAVRFVEMRGLGGNPNRIIPAWREFVAENITDGKPGRGIGEPIWPGREGAELDECHLHESLLNLAFDAGPAWSLVCPYDTAALPAGVIEHARRTHPHVGSAHAVGRSRHYHDPYLDPLAGELPPPPAEPEELAFTLGDLGTVRVLALAWGRGAGLSEARAADLVLAVNELAANSVRHGGGRGAIRSWREPGRLVCEVRDSGRIEDPLAGRGLPSDDYTGRGLWIVNQLCDLVQLRSDDSGAAVRLHMGTQAGSSAVAA